MEVAAGRGVDWFLLRPVVDPRIPDGLADVRERWTLPDLLDTHQLLDALDDIEAIRQERADEQARNRKGG